MIRRFVVTTIRSLYRDKGYTAINVIGLTLGLTGFLLVFLFVQHEYSFDRFHVNGDRIYRLLDLIRYGGEDRWNDDTLGSIALELRQSHPQVESVVRMSPCPAAVIRVGAFEVREREVWCAESDLFEVFTLPLEASDPSEVLDRPDTAVLTRSLAVSLFGQRSPIGESVEIVIRDSTHVMEVTGVMDDIPTNSHFHFEIAISYSTRSSSAQLSNSRQYLVLRDGADPEAMTSAIRDFVVNDLQDGWVTDVKLQPLREVYFSDMVAQRNGDVRYVRLLAVIAFLILGIACANYINLTTARSLRRAREVGIRKVVGATRVHLVLRFLAEGYILIGVALFFSAGLIVLVLPTFNELADTSVVLDVLGSRLVVAGVILTVACVGLVAAGYPAVALSSQQPVSVMRGQPSRLVGRGLFGRSSRQVIRRSLVVVQFMISTCLLVGTIVVVRQLEFMQDRKLGFDAEQVVVVSIEPRGLLAKAGAIEQAFRQHRSVLGSTRTFVLPGQLRFSNSPKMALTAPGSGEEPVSFTMATIDDQFLDFLEIPLLAGRNIGSGVGDDGPYESLLNETGARILGWTPDEAVGRELNKLLFVGVVPDFHFASLHREIGPLILRQNRAELWPAVALRLRHGDTAATLAELDQIWRQFEPGAPLEVVFMDDELNQLYASEQRTSRVFGVFSFVAVLIAALGLLGVALFSCELRTREVGIRKALGASVSSIVTLLLADSVKTVLAGIVLALPIAYVLMQRYLAGFAYRIPLSADIFLTASLAAVVVAAFTVGLHTMRLASVNPADTLRYE